LTETNCGCDRLAADLVFCIFEILLDYQGYGMILLEHNMLNRSSRKRARQILGVITSTRAEQILKELANVPGQWWPLVENPIAYKRSEAALDRIRSLYSEAFEDCPMIALMVLRDLLRKAWTAPDERAAGWYLFRLRHLHSETLRRVRHVQTVKGKPEPEIPTVPGTEDEAKRTIEQSEPPPTTELEASAFYIQKNLRRALYCPNPDCPAPYFFKSKKRQKFCSPECALPTLLASKRKWWNENRAKSKRRK
jgi:hypothetical protein